MKQQEWQQNPETTMHSSSTVVSQVNLSLLHTKNLLLYLKLCLNANMTGALKRCRCVCLCEEVTSKLLPQTQNVNPRIEHVTKIL